jgi:putative autotransporter adhesin-like protein
MTRTVFVAASLLSCTSFAHDHVRGSGNVRREIRVVPAFTGVAVAGGIRGEVQIGQQRVELSGDDNVLPLVETVVEDGVLVVRFKPHISLDTQEPVVVQVSAPSIDALESSGGSRLRASLIPTDDLTIDSSGGGDVEARKVAVKKLRADVSGGGALVLEGSADEVKLGLSGGSRCKGKEFRARTMRIQASGGSTARLAVSESVRGSASGGSVVRVSGSPEMRVASSGGSVVDSD